MITISKEKEERVYRARDLIGQSGYGTQYMNQGHYELGCRSWECSGTVVDWLARMDDDRLNGLIQHLEETNGRQGI